jgi:hypothetical protein
MFKETLYFLMLILVLSQPIFIKMLNSSILGRIAIIVSAIFLGLQNPILGFVYAFFIIAAISSESVGVENFSRNNNNLEPSQFETEKVVEDREKIEKQLITPTSFNTNEPIISPLEYDEIDEPSANEPETGESFLNYSYIEPSNSE